MFSGRYEHSIDDKGRTSIPVKFREKLSGPDGDLLWVTTEVGNHLVAFTAEQWRRFQEKLAALDEFDEDAEALRLFYVGSAVECPIDKQGRILLPQTLREHARIQSEVVWVGQTNKIAIWSKETWNEQFPSLQERAKQARRALAERSRG